MTGRKPQTVKMDHNDPLNRQLQPKNISRGNCPEPC